MPRLKLIPWEPTWLAHPYLDLHAVYRRPVRNRVTWQIERDEHGFVKWDLTTPMSIRNHVKLLQKGFEYVTLATPDDVIQAASPTLQDRGATPLGGPGRPPNERPDDYIRQGSLRGPWDSTAYLADLQDATQARIERLISNVADMGPDNAERFERERDPDYVLPDRYRQAAAAVETDDPPKRKRGRPRKTPTPEPAGVA